MSSLLVEQIAVDLIDGTKKQVRSAIDREKLANLAESVRANGVLQPIDVVANGRGRYDVVFGHRRLLAAREAGLKTIPSIVRDAPPSVPEGVVLQLAENKAREPIGVMDLAESLQTLISVGGLSVGEAAKQVGISASEVSKSLALNGLPKPIQDRVRSGQISASAAYVLSQVDDPEAQAELAARVATGEVTRDQLAGAARRARNKTGPASGACCVGRVAAPLGDGRTVVLSGPGVDTMDGMIKCLEDLLARARKARPQGIEVRTFAKMLRDQAKRPAAG